MNRRDFLKAVTAAGGAIALPGIAIASGGLVGKVAALVGEVSGESLLPVASGVAGAIRGITLHMRNEFRDVHHWSSPVVLKYPARAWIELDVDIDVSDVTELPGPGSVVRPEWFRKNGIEALMEKSRVSWPDDEWEFRVTSVSVGPDSVAHISMTEIARGDPFQVSVA